MTNSSPAIHLSGGVFGREQVRDLIAEINAAVPHLSKLGAEMSEETFSKEQLDAAIKEAVSAATKEADERVSAMDAKITEILSEKKAAAAKAKEAEEAATKAAEDAARKSNDTDALDKSWQEKYGKLESEKDATIAELRASIEDLTVGAWSNDIAASLNPQEGCLPDVAAYVRKRISAENVEGIYQARYLDADGKPAAMSKDELVSEMLTMPVIKHLTIGTKGSGGGAAGSGGGATSKKFSEMTGAELVTLRRSNPQEYDRLKAAG